MAGLTPYFARNSFQRFRPQLSEGFQRFTAGLIDLLDADGRARFGVNPVRELKNSPLVFRNLPFQGDSPCETLSANGRGCINKGKD